ncbi:MAG: transposase [Deltaproteobacteria bacterium]|nr:transposase [Deltaproteobacteria bacterium]
MPSFPSVKMSVPPLQAGRRRRFSDDEKRALLTEAFLNHETLSELGRRHGIAVGLLFRWQRRLGVTRLSVCGDMPKAQRVATPAEQRLADLERQLNALLQDNSALQERLARVESLNRVLPASATSSQHSH